MIRKNKTNEKYADSKWEQTVDKKRRALKSRRREGRRRSRRHAEWITEVCGRAKVIGE